MQIVTTVGPDNLTKVGVPFVAATAAAEDGESVDFFLIQEATYLASGRHSDWSALASPGLDPIESLFGTVREHDALGEFVVCEPCTGPRGIDEGDLRPFARLGGPDDLLAQARRHETSLTF